MRLWKPSPADHAYGSKKGICLGVKPFTHPGDFVARSVHAPRPPSGRCASPPGPPGSPPGSLGPRARAAHGLSSDGGMKTPTFALSGLQPGDRRREERQKSHTKTLNIDLSFSDRAPNGLVRSRRIAGGADQAAARVDKAFPMILTTRKTRINWRRRSIASCEDRSARAVLRVRSGHPVPETWVATLAASPRPPGAERRVHRGKRLD